MREIQFGDHQRVGVNLIRAKCVKYFFF